MKAEHAKIVAEEEARWEALRGKYLRVTRVLIYEGSAEDLRQQLVKSRPVGKGALPFSSGIQLAVYQDDIEVIEQPDHRTPQTEVLDSLTDLMGKDTLPTSARNELYRIREILRGV